MKIILGISGSIAAYKAAHLTRLWVKQGSEVQVLMTEAATSFITPLTLSTLSKHPVFTDVRSEAGWNNHVELGLWADAVVIAPASANTLAKMANGLCDNILSAVYLSARCPVFVAPAMDVDMWHHPATRENIRRLEAHGVRVIPVGHGELASGLVGEGRMAEPEEIVAFVEASIEDLTTFKKLSNPKALTGKKALVTAGPTFEDEQRIGPGVTAERRRHDDLQRNRPAAVRRPVLGYRQRAAVGIGRTVGERARVQLRQHRRHRPLAGRADQDHCAKQQPAEPAGRPAAARSGQRTTAHASVLWRAG